MNDIGIGGEGNESWMGVKSWDGLIMGFRNRSAGWHVAGSIRRGGRT